jgi:hypothetical protein
MLVRLRVLLERLNTNYISHVADPHFVPYAEFVINFAAYVYSDVPGRTDSVIRGAIGVLG